MPETQQENKQEAEKPEKKKKGRDPARMAILPNNLAEHIQTMGGLSSDEIIKLLESIERIDERTKVTLQRPVPRKNTSRPAKGKQGNMKIAAAVNYEKKRAAQRVEKEQQVLELFNFDSSVLPHEELNGEYYPKRMTPDDIATNIKAARQNLLEIDQHRIKAARPSSPNEEAVLNVMMNIKRMEAARIAGYIARKQRDLVLGKTPEQLEQERKERIEQIKIEAGLIPPPDRELTEEEKKAEEDEKQKAIRTLQGFGKDIHTLADEAGDLAGENIEAAAAVVKQWIGNVAEKQDEK
ncbi:hypothetical protein FACS18942_03400 [Planctomycetales bacterium]|nr:hypothetical protein FACS18942_03400 [Planctomycetales bacterium]